MPDYSKLKIPKEIRLQDLKEFVIGKLDIVAFYGQYLTGNFELKSFGHDGFSNRVLCPLHNDTTSPNFFINKITGNFSCQACNKRGGSVFDFWLLKNQMSLDSSNFIHALCQVANFACINIEEYLNEHRKEISSGKLPEELYAAKTAAHLKKQSLPKRASTDELDRDSKPINKEVIERCCAALRAEHIKYLVTKRGLTKKTIDQYQIGFLDDTPQFRNVETGEFVRGRYAIPIFDREGRLRNIRLYSPVCNSDFKMLNYVVDKDKDTEKKYGKPARLLNLQRILSGRYTNIVICEGEFKAILLDQMFQDNGYDTWIATTGTHGSGSFLEEWLDNFTGMNVYFCFDCDESGRVQAKNHCSEFFLPHISSGKFQSVRIVELPLKGDKDEKDITDWFVKLQYSMDDLMKVIIDSPPIVAGGIEEDEASVEPVKVLDLNTLTSDRRFIDQRVEVPLSVVSAAEQTYHAIRSACIDTCPLMAAGECCQSGADDTNIPYGHPMFIASCMEREENVLGRLKSILCTKDLDGRQMSRVKVTPKKKVVMELYYAQQLVQRTRQNIDESEKSVLDTDITKLTHVQVYLLQSEIPLNVEPKGYTATGWVRTHPKTSTAVLFIEKMIPIEDDWRKFSIKNQESREIIKYLRDGITTEVMINEIIGTVTKIFDADEILLAVLLTFLSPLRFFFNGSMLRGWITTIILGDSGVGKSSTYTRFSDWVGVGSWFSSQTGSRTGLVYAVIRKGDGWYVTAGDYIQASGTIIAADEFQMLPKETTRMLGSAIDCGRIEIKRAASGTYEARTRLLLIGNAIKINGDQATLSDWIYGCESLGVCLDPMLIRRVDVAIFCSQEPNKEELYNKFIEDKEVKKSDKLSAKMMQSLIYWAWTREPRHIDFTEEAVKRCLKLATELSKVYSVDKIPLVNPNDFRENLARLSVAYAILERSIADDMETLIVKPEHVELIAAFINQIYSAPACGLKNYAEEMSRINRMDGDEFARIKENMNTFTNEDLTSNQDYYRTTFPTLRVLVYAKNTRKFTLREIMEVTGLNMNWLRRRIDHFKCLDLISDSERGTFVITRKFNLFMVRWRQEPDVEARLEYAKNRMFVSMPPEVSKDKPENNSNSSGNGNNGSHEYKKQKPPAASAANIDDPFFSDPFQDSQI